MAGKREMPEDVVLIYKFDRQTRTLGATAVRRTYR